MEAGLNGFVMTPKKWIEATNAIGIVSKSGRYGGTYAHRDIALEFASWISIEFKLYFLKEFQRLKEEEQKALGWSAKRELAKKIYCTFIAHISPIQTNIRSFMSDIYELCDILGQHSRQTQINR
jgi:hypothetical protein